MGLRNCDDITTSNLMLEISVLATPEIAPSSGLLNELPINAPLADPVISD